MATPAIPPKPSNAAMSATMRNVTAQPNIVVTSVVGYGTAAAWQGNVNKVQWFLRGMRGLEQTIITRYRSRNCFANEPVHSICLILEAAV
jgi:hypothetical protein